MPSAGCGGSRPGASELGFLRKEGPAPQPQAGRTQPLSYRDQACWSPSGGNSGKGTSVVGGADAGLPVGGEKERKRYGALD